MSEAFGLAIVDLDGTLVRLGWGPGDMARVRGRLRMLFAPYLPNATFKPLLPGLNDAVKAVEYVQGAQLASQLGRTARALIDEVEVAAAAQATARQGAHDLIRVLAGQMPLALVTSQGRRAAEHALRSAGIDSSRFATLVTANDVRAPKPAQEPYEIALLRVLGSEWSTADPSVLVIGDRAADLEAAWRLRAAHPRIRVCAVAVLGGLDPAEDLERWQPDRVVPELTDLLPR